MIMPPLSALLVGSSLIVAVADEVPKLDVMPSCRAASSVPPANLESCLKDEDNARKVLAGNWTQFNAGDRATCTRDNTVAGLSSYVVLRTCLEMARDARKLPKN
jgi:acetyl-CoA acetyltransferase